MTSTQQVTAVITEDDNSFQITIKYVVINGREYTIEILHGYEAGHGYSTDLSFLNFDEHEASKTIPGHSLI